MSASLREYVETWSMPVPFQGCWMWLKSVGSHGYGQASPGGGRGQVTAHRLSFEAFKGPILKGTLVQHSCDRRWCVNPDHLSLGTDKSNADDKMRKGRDGLKDRRFIREIPQPSALREPSAKVTREANLIMADAW